MDKISTEILRIQRFVADATTTKTALAARAGLPLQTLIGMESPAWNPRAVTLRALAKAVDKFESDAAKKKARDGLRAQRKAA